MCGGIAVERNPLGSTVPLNSSYEESFGCGNISMFTQQEINRESLLIDSAIKVSPSPSDSDIRLVNAP
jgi:hypothetical protein